MGTWELGESGWRKAKNNREIFSKSVLSGDVHETNNKNTGIAVYANKMIRSRAVRCKRWLAIRIFRRWIVFEDSGQYTRCVSGPFSFEIKQIGSIFFVHSEETA